MHIHTVYAYTYCICEYVHVQVCMYVCKCQDWVIWVMFCLGKVRADLVSKISRSDPDSVMNHMH